ncbi:hypothetical protein LTR74_016903 [Friedmanniomyces endolithicus]|nr:hypothetical protein LTR74_016903 [Friedmanniomyces endolithicus]
MPSWSALPFIHDGKEWRDSDIHLGDITVSTHVIEYDFGREYENGFRRRTGVESVRPRAPAEVANFINQFVRARSEAFDRVLRKTNVDVADYAKLQTAGGAYHSHPGPNADLATIWDIAISMRIRMCT